jgi:hypothetical protein
MRAMRKKYLEQVFDLIYLTNGDFYRKFLPSVKYTYNSPLLMVVEEFFFQYGARWSPLNI